MTLRRQTVPYHHQFRFSFRLVTISISLSRTKKVTPKNDEKTTLPIVCTHLLIHFPLKMSFT